MKKSTIFLSVLCLWLGLCSISVAQSSLTLLSLSAHPDDEDGSALAYYGKLKNVKTYSIFYTRGEGGQNEIGSQLGEELGILRTKETLGAAVFLGSEVFFLGFPDFGFSKTAKETFAMWGGKDSVLARLVYAIRVIKPDVIITNHDTITTKPNRQHGNHQAVGITAYEAFEKAADPSYHPEQLNGDVAPWQVKNLFFRFLNRGNVAQDSLVTLDTKRRDVSGKTIDEIAMHALSMHRSQGMDKIVLDSVPSFFRQHKYYMVRSALPYAYDSTDLFSGIIPQPQKRFSVPAIEFNPVLLHQARENSPASVRAKYSKNILIGLVATYDQTIEQTLRAYNIRYEKLDSATLAKGKLGTYSTIILDLRAYEYRHDAVRYNDRLLLYVKNGGNLICLYHKPGDWNGKNFAPYPVTLTGERVTEETAPVTMLNPSHRLFNKPNKITNEDWNDWVQERSIYLPSDDTTKTSPRYERLLAMSDTDEQQPPTSLLYTTFGKGTYMYVSLALYRQLRNYNEGAVKLFFNLISRK
ncbi:MAG: PIG-L family deacetylase [Bacteroidetes bacterium]|nr:MAG: PIG-L family deacetylase [Bacteroidota bacterium]